MSVFEVKVATGTERVQVNEIWSITLEEFCGREFGFLIQNHLEKIIIGRLRGAASADSLERLNFLIKRDNAQNATPEAIANARELANLRVYFQSREGAFSTIERGGMGVLLLDGMGELRSSPISQPEIEEAFRPAFSREEPTTNCATDGSSTPPLTAQRIMLINANGRQYPITFDVQDIKAALIGITMQAYDAYFV